MLFEKAARQKLEVLAAEIKEKEDLSVRVRLWSGEQYDFGAFDAPKVTLTVRGAEALSLLAAPNLGNLAEAYVTELIDIDGAIGDVIDTGYRLAALTPPMGGPTLVERTMRRFAHTRESDKESVQYHYDVSNAFYQRWLDRNLLYSCAYFENGDEDLDAAQIKKMDTILRKIRLQPGQRLLDIGCGWGALVLHAAQTCGAHCVGITLSQNQYEFAKARVEEAGLERKVDIRLQDYRDIDERFDRIVSIGMFEHVGLANLAGYFARISHLLADDGVALNHGITSSDPDSRATPLGGGNFIGRHVFPSGELPHISLTLQTMQQGGLEALDVENWRRHYARTLQLWSARFEAQGALLREMVGEKAYRIWRVYLPGCARAFELGHVSVFQVLCQKARGLADVIPWSRRYMYPPTEGGA